MKHLSSVLVRTMIALLGVMLASLALAIAFGTQAVTQHQYQMNIAQKEANVGTMATLLDNDFFDYFTLATQISTMPDLRPINLKETDPVSQIRARDLLEAFKGANRRIIDICLYMREEDYFVTSLATYQPQSFIQSYYSFGSIDRSEVYELFRGTTALKAQGQTFPYFLPLGSVNTSANDTAVSDALLILLPISQWSSKPHATLGILVQTDDIREQLSIVADEGAARMIDVHGNTLVCVGEERLSEGFAQSESVYTFRRPSSRFDLSYEVYVEESALYRTHFTATRLIMTLILLSLLVSLACLFFARWVNQPIRQLITHMGGTNSRLVDESSYIREYIYQLGKNVEQNEKYVSELLVRRLLAGQPLSDSELARCESLLRKDYAHCTVAAVRLNRRLEHVLPLTTKVYEHALLNILQEAQLETLICIIASDETDEDLMRQVKGMLADPLLRDAQIVTLGPIEDDPLRLRDSMLRAMSRVKEMMYQGRSGVEMANDHRDRRNSYPSDAMHHLKEAMQAKDASALRSYCENLCEILLDARMNPETGAIVAYDLANLFPELSEHVSCSAQEFCRLLRESVKDACAGFESQPPESETAAGTDGLKREIKACVEEMLEQPGFGISAISERYGMSDSAFSHMFKRTFGVTFISYVNQKKIQRAKQLLSETNFSLDVIALRLGYSSASNFTRMFKKYEDITPGAYRQFARTGIAGAGDE